MAYERLGRTADAIEAYTAAAALAPEDPVALVNRGGDDATFEGRFEALGADGVGDDTEFAVRELWEGRDMGVARGSVSATVKANDIAVFRLSISS